MYDTEIIVNKPSVFTIWFLFSPNNCSAYTISLSPKPLSILKSKLNLLKFSEAPYCSVKSDLLYRSEIDSFKLFSSKKTSETKLNVGPPKKLILLRKTSIPTNIGILTLFSENSSIIYPSIFHWYVRSYLLLIFEKYISGLKKKLPKFILEKIPNWCPFFSSKIL